MENKVLQKNLEIISSYDTNLADRILMFEKEKSTLQNNYSLAISANGEYNILYNNVPIHNPLSPIEEAKNIIKNLPDKKNVLRIIFGFGLGYLADELAQETTHAVILIYEPKLELLDVVLNLANISALAQNNVILCNDKETFKNHVFDLTDENTEISISFLDFYKNNYMDEIKEILELAQIEQGKKKANINTLISKSTESIANTIHNIRSFPSCAIIDDFKDIYKGKNALIISAGPSASENIEIIKKNKDKFIIFAVGSIAGLLNENGIIPDFIVDIESWALNVVYENIDISKSCLILESFSNARKYIPQAKGRILYISKNNFLNNWIRKLFDCKIELKTLGTVTYSAIKSAEIMGFKNIILIGSDLAFKDGACYSKGSQFENLQYIFDEKEQKYKIVTPDIKEYARSLFKADGQGEIEGAQYSLECLNKNLYSVKSYDGKILPSKTDYAIFIRYFEELAKEIKENNPEINLYNCSLGALIKGFDDIPLSGLLSKLEKIQKTELVFKNHLNKQKLIEDTELILKYFKDYYSIAQELADKSAKIISELKNKKVLTENILKRIKKHNEELKLLLKFKTEEDFSMLFAQYNFLIIPIIENVNIKDLDKHIELFIKLGEIYNKILTEIQIYTNILTDSKLRIVQ